MNSLFELIQSGQSYWMDNLSRGMIRSGALKKRIASEGLRGITSNPAIFNKAISKSSDYDAQIQELARRQMPVEDIYEELAIKDVQDACDLLRPVFDESKGVDGFVSLEVSPYLAHDTERTMEETRRLFNAVDRPIVFDQRRCQSKHKFAVRRPLSKGRNRPRPYPMCSKVLTDFDPFLTLLGRSFFSSCRQP